MEKCKYCGWKIGTVYGKECDGKLTLGPDPFAVEIYDDYTESWDCAGNRYESAMDI